MLKLIERLGPIDEGTASDTLTLPFELRIRGRLKAESDSGQPLGLFLDRGPVLRAFQQRFSSPPSPWDAATDKIISISSHGGRRKGIIGFERCVVSCGPTVS